MRSKLVIVLFLVLLAASLVACTPQETGEITFISPNVENSKLHGDVGQVILVVNSTYPTPKTGYMFSNDVLKGQCLIVQNTRSTCPPIVFDSPGVYTLSLGYTKADGKGEFIKTSVEWSPYTEMDKFAQSLAGGDGKSPAMGYAIMIAGLVILSTIILAIVGAGMTKGSPQGLSIGATLGFFTSLILLAIAVYINASPGLALMVVGAIVLIIIAGLVTIMVVNATNHGYTATSPEVRIIGFDSQGNRLEGNFAQPYLGPERGAPNLTMAVESFSNTIAANSQRQIENSGHHNLLED